MALFCMLIRVQDHGTMVHDGGGMVHNDESMVFEDGSVHVDIGLVHDDDCSGYSTYIDGCVLHDDSRMVCLMFVGRSIMILSGT